MGPTSRNHQVGDGLIAIFDEVMGASEQPETFQQDVVLRSIDLVATCAGIPLRNV